MTNWVTLSDFYLVVVYNKLEASSSKEYHSPVVSVNARLGKKYPG
jgi:hypothetical protein